MEQKSTLKTKIILILIVLLVICCICSTISSVFIFKNYVGSGVTISESREVDSFSEVVLDGSMDLILVQGDLRRVEIKAENNIIGYIKTSTANNKLEVKIEKPALIGFLYPRQPIQVLVTVPDLTKITTYGSATISGEKIKMDNLTVTINGSGNVDLNVFLDRLDAYIQGSADFNLTGIVDDQNIVVNGSGNYESRDLKTERTFITINGSASATINATESIDAQINGSGEIKYTGGATVNPIINGSGSVTQL